MLDNEPLTNKKKRGRGQLAEVGHNTTVEDSVTRSFIERFGNLETEIFALRRDQKELLNEAKGAGLSKMAIRGAVKRMFMSEEQKQAKDEVAALIEHYTRLCADLPLFDAAAA
jgi:uncharacterized protein (UPF0335 family)